MKACAIYGIQFIWVNRMLRIAHAFIWLPVSFVLPHRKQLVELNRMSCITHATKIWTVFDASVIANIMHILDGSLTPPFAIIASHIVSRRLSDRSVALAASCNSDKQTVYIHNSAPHLHLFHRFCCYHYCKMLLARHYDQRPFDETVCDAIIANGGVKNRQKCIKHLRRRMHQTRFRF